MTNKYRDRRDAGQQLVESLKHYENDDNAIVLGLPRGGVPVAAEVASALNLPLDIFVVRKLGTPGREELAMGAIASGGVRLLNNDLVRSLNISQNEIKQVQDREFEELRRRESAYRDGRPEPKLADRIVILVDDGTATGASMKAAIEGLKQHNPAKIIAALPVGAESACRTIEKMVDELICLMTPRDFRGVGVWYERFDQTTDEQVRHLLQQTNQAEAG